MNGFIQHWATAAQWSLKNWLKTNRGDEPLRDQLTYPLFEGKVSLSFSEYTEEYVPQNQIGSGLGAVKQGYNLVANKKT
ncbi:hypothetical protein GCM10007875_20680 [Limnobacter litoralis]|uniref:Uncharacterized protein n=1 Tax=Limnobacter litoralis TaxID=481366 RepID=A0ABQ5YR27_9BURK|nr:hypothetical protein GCM10007875_20680 [Limnobacter litoralis]